METRIMKSKYHRQIRTEVIDVYDILVAYNVTCPATAHAIKKLLMPGIRGSKSTLQDLIDAYQSIQRAKELEVDSIEVPEQSIVRKHVLPDKEKEADEYGAMMAAEDATLEEKATRAQRNAAIKQKMKNKEGNS